MTTRVSGLRSIAIRLRCCAPDFRACASRTAADLADLKTGRIVRACGIVTVRQRPGTANGTIFVSIEDETGAINVIVWPGLVEKQRKVLLGASLLGVHGVWQNEGDV